MLQNIEQIPQKGHILLPSILTYTGLKQGDNLSPPEFNVFFDDVTDIFYLKCDPVQLFIDITISHLLFADDMIMLFTSVNGMQRCFDNLEVYCDKCQLEVSIKNTKILALNSSGKVPQKIQFHFDGMKVEIVKNHRYLGSLILSSGSNIPAEEKLKGQGDKAYFSLQKIMNRISYAPNLCLDLFVNSVRPILTYNCEF